MVLIGFSIYFFKFPLNHQKFVRCCMVSLLLPLFLLHTHTPHPHPSLWIRSFFNRCSLLQCPIILIFSHSMFCYCTLHMHQWPNKSSRLDIGISNLLNIFPKLLFLIQWNSVITNSVIMNSVITNQFFGHYTHQPGYNEPRL